MIFLCCSLIGVVLVAAVIVIVEIIRHRSMMIGQARGKELDVLVQHIGLDPPRRWYETDRMLRERARQHVVPGRRRETHP